MRFSLKWLLAGMTYAALASAALTSEHGPFGYWLWVATLYPLIYASLLAFTRRGRCRGGAIGFIAASLVYLAGVLLVEDSMPSTRVAELGFGMDRDVLNASPQLAEMSIRLNPRDSLKASLQAEHYQRRLSSRWWLRNTCGAAHAVGAMLAGLIGAALGAFAARHAGVNAPRGE